MKSLLGGAVYIQPETRVAFAYTPKSNEKYKGKTEHTRINTDGSLDYTNKHDTAQILSESQQLAIGVSHKIESVKLLAGVKRYFPSTIEYDFDYESSTSSGTTSGTSKTSAEDNGTNIFSVGAEKDFSADFVLTGNVHHYLSRDTEASGFAVGADFNLSSVEISPTISYDSLKFDYESAAEDMKGTRLLLALAVGTTF